MRRGRHVSHERVGASGARLPLPRCRAVSFFFGWFCSVIASVSCRVVPYRTGRAVEPAWHGGFPAGERVKDGGGPRCGGHYRGGSPRGRAPSQPNKKRAVATRVTATQMFGGLRGVPVVGCVVCVVPVPQAEVEIDNLGVLVN